MSIVDMGLFAALVHTVPCGTPARAAGVPWAGGLPGRAVAVDQGSRGVVVVVGV